MLCIKLYFLEEAKINNDNSDRSFIHLDISKMSAGTPPRESFFSVQGILIGVHISSRKQIVLRFI